MITQPRLLASVAALALFADLTSLADGKTRADCEQEYRPQRAQEGKDVIWAPTPDAVVLRMLEMAKVAPADTVYDLGAGDGKIAIAAGKHFGATAVGVEYDPDLVKHAQCLAAAEGVEARVTFVQGDIFEADFSDATVVALYLTTTVNLRLRPTLLDMKPGTRVVTYSFTMGDWSWDQHIDTDEGSAYLWIVPANAAGAWTFRPVSGEGSFDVVARAGVPKSKGHRGGRAGDRQAQRRQDRFHIPAGGQQTHVAGTVDSGSHHGHDHSRRGVRGVRRHASLNGVTHATRRGPLPGDVMRASACERPGAL